MSRFGSRTRVSTYLSGWMPTGDEVVVATLLVVAGGGSGGLGHTGGGGGGGGLLEGTMAVVLGTSYTVTVGAGGYTDPTNQDLFNKGLIGPAGDAANLAATSFFIVGWMSFMLSTRSLITTIPVLGCAAASVCASLNKAPLMCASLYA